MNRVDLIGRLTQNAELRYTASGKAVANARLAVNRKFKRDEADFINLIFWDKTAEALANYTQKGSRIGVEGRIETGSYEKDGRKVYTTDIVVEQLHFLDNKGDSQPPQQQAAENNPYQPGGQADGLSADDPDSLPF